MSYMNRFHDLNAFAAAQARYDNAAPPDERDDSDAIAAAHDAIVDALTAGHVISVIANGTHYKVDEADVCELLNPTVMLAIAELIRAGDQIEAARRFSIEWARAIEQCAEKNAEFRLELERKQ
jgi:hypothetical protein